ncbi:GtrA family protein [Corynebacterium ciconiae]|uniref:GtrA family protein n=1 Tax=Corynebacterium ciconiae TaxID=227319 RepID=UPI0009FECB4C
MKSWIGALSYVAGGSFAYALNSKFTFSGHKSLAEIRKAAISYFLCFSVAVLVDLISRGVCTGSYFLLVSWVVSQGAATVINFLLQNVWVFPSEASS